MLMEFVYILLILTKKYNNSERNYEKPGTFCNLYLSPKIAKFQNVQSKVVSKYLG